MNNIKTNLLMLLVAALAIFVPQISMATGLSDVGTKVCEVYDCIVNNNLLLIIATVAILMLGIGAFFGKVNWGLVVIIVLGIVVIFGALSIAQALAGSGATIAASCHDGVCSL